MSTEATDEHAPEEELEEARPARTSGIVWLGDLIDEVINVRVVERDVADGPLVERLLRGVLHQGARHAAVRLTRDRGALTYHSQGQWEPTRTLPAAMLRDIRSQLVALIARAEPSCDHGLSHTIDLTVPGIGSAAFRLHVVETASLWVISPLPRGDGTPSIVDRRHARTRRALFATGRKRLEQGSHVDAVLVLQKALDMAELLGRPSEQLLIQLTLGCANELAGRFLRAEREYKRCLKRIEEAYGRHDLQRMAVFSRLAHCAATRGDRAVAEMWSLRGQHGRTLLEGK